MYIMVHKCFNRLYWDSNEVKCSDGKVLLAEHVYKLRPIHILLKDPSLVNVIIHVTNYIVISTAPALRDTRITRENDELT